MSQNSNTSRVSTRRSSTNSSINSNSTLSESAVFSQRIVSVDCYTSYPISQMDPLISEFRGSEVKRVPVIRIYGATPRGQKTCTHVHGVFPYIYIEDTSEDDDFEYLLALALDNAINSFFNSTRTGEHVNYQHVFKISKVLGKSLYGYKSNISSFLQIFFYSPISLKKGVDLLESGKILGQKFQPYEAHIPYILQFFLDYKLYGMNFIHYGAIKFRRRETGQCLSTQLVGKTPTTTGHGSKIFWDLETLQEDLFLPPKVLSRCRLELEIDVKASDILVSDSTHGKNPGIVDIWVDEKERRRQHSLVNWADITIPQSPDRSNPDDFVFPRERELLQILGDQISGAVKSSELKESSQHSLINSSQTSLNSQSRLDLQIPSASTPNNTVQQMANGSDGEIINLLEVVDIDKEESDSILPSSQHIDSKVVTSDFGAYASEVLQNDRDQDYEVEDEWAEDFLSQTTIDLLEKWEKDIQSPIEESVQSESNMNPDQIQCDGQVDESDESEVDRPKRIKLTNTVPYNSQRPLALSRRRTRKQALDTKCAISVENNIKPKNQILDSDSSDSDCQIISVVQSTPKLNVVPVVRPETPESKENYDIVNLDSDEDENILENESSAKIQKEQRFAEKKVAVAEINECGQNQMESKDETNSNDKDSGITSFYDISHLPEADDESSSDSSSSQEILPASPEHTTMTKRITMSPATTNTNLPSSHNDFITSVYKYDGETSAEDENEQDLNMVPASKNILNGLSPIKELPCGNVAGEESSMETSVSPNTSFQNIEVDYSVPAVNSGVSEYSNFESLSDSKLEPSSNFMLQPQLENGFQENEGDLLEVITSIQDSELSDFQSKKNQHQTLRKNRREQVLAFRNNLRPSIFPFQIHPLKQTPLSSDIERWCTENNGSVINNEEEASSLKYLRERPEGNEAREKLIEDVIRFSRTLAKNREKFALTPGNEILQEIANTRTIPSGNVSKIAEDRAVDMITNHAKKPFYHQTGKNIDGDESSDDTDTDDEISTKVKKFRFVGAGPAGEQSDSCSTGSDDNDDDDTIVASPSSSASQSQAGSPMVFSHDSESNVKSTTPRSILVRKRSFAGPLSKKRLSFNLDELGQTGENKSKTDVVPQFHPDDSELDTLSFHSKSPTNAQLNSSNLQQVKASHEHQFLTTLAVEVHCSARGDLVPDPEQDAINAITYALHNDSPENDSADEFVTKLFLVDSSKEENCQIENEESFPDEVTMLRQFIDFVHSCDPDIFVGYEVEKFSWGYLIQRGMKLGINMISELSRVLPLPYASKDSTQDHWNETINGRIVFNLWKLLRHEVAVTSYTFESMSLQILHEKVHRLSYKILHNYWNISEKRPNVKNYFKTRVVNLMRIIYKLDLINRTSELARLFGIQFFEVLSRGSQFRVESMMLRLAKPENLIPPSPNPMQRARMKAPEYLPLILEPESKFYTDPVAVLDFQSLYPSMMIAYNYCFSTCIGRLEYLGEDCFELGCLYQDINRVEIAELFEKGLLHISPCRVVFVKPKVRKGILSTMLEQILDTRQMVKRSMKKWKDNESLQKVLDSRQLGLKLIANVTYGYTSANWSGRMPCVEIADSIVSKGRETLQRAIDYVMQNEHIFGGKVVYGDTDSLFVHFPGKTKQEAFTLAQQIVNDITQQNPKPVKLKLEKIYQPCILQTKKRYVGFAYETPDQKEPKYDAKGIETVRRDGCPATAKILEGALRILFTSQKEEHVKKFVIEQFRKIFLGRVSLSKYTFARKFRGRLGYKPGARVPSLEIAKKLGEKDKRAEPLPKERVPYIVIYGNPLAPLIERVRRPEEFISDPNLRLNSHYYIEKAIIPALNRCLTLAGYHADKWLNEMPRKYLKSDYIEGDQQKKGTIDQYFVSQKCIKCESRAVNGFCQSCFETPNNLREFLTHQNNHITSKYESYVERCQACSKETDTICINMDCPVKHKLLRYTRDYHAKLPKIRELQNHLAILDW